MTIAIDEWGIDLTIEQAITGWWDDFMGDVLAPQYTVTLSGTGSSYTLGYSGSSISCGNLRMQSGNVTDAYCLLWLGATSDGMPNIDADDGWRMGVHWRAVYGETYAAALFGASDSAGNNVIVAGVDSNASSNYVIKTRTGGGTVNWANSGVAFSGAWCHLWLDVYKQDSTYYVEFSRNGTLLASTSTSVPSATITPCVYIQSRAAEYRYMDLEYWVVIPRYTV